MIVEFIISLPPIRLVTYLIKKPLILSIVVAVGIGLYFLIRPYVDAYIEEYHRLNSEKEEEVVEEPHLEFTKIDDGLYTLIGGVGSGDCERIAPQMPDRFALILESPGGNLAEGSCIAAHLKIRDVVTVVREDPVINENGEVIYQPGSQTKDMGPVEGKSMCASACSIMFLAGDKRYLIGDVMFGIHGPGVPPQMIGQLDPKQLEMSSYRTATALLELLIKLGVEDPDLRHLFIKIPNHTMYWVHPRDFDAKEGLHKIATNYKNFFGLTYAQVEDQ